MELHQTKEFLHSKNPVSRFKRQSTKWEKIFANYSPDKGVMSRIYRELKKRKFQRTKIPMKKWAHEIKREVSKEEYK
jgi:hypothetical protein